MSEAHVWAALCAAALLGWGVTLGLMSRASIQVANAFSVLEKMDARVDERINAILQRVRRREEERKPQAPASRPVEREEAPPTVPGFSGVSGFLISEQPDVDDELEIVDA